MAMYRRRRWRTGSPREEARRGCGLEGIATPRESRIWPVAWISTAMYLVI